MSKIFGTASDLRFAATLPVLALGSFLIWFFVLRNPQKDSIVLKKDITKITHDPSEPVSGSIVGKKNKAFNPLKNVPSIFGMDPRLDPAQEELKNYLEHWADIPEQIVFQKWYPSKPTGVPDSPGGIVVRARYRDLLPTPKDKDVIAFYWNGKITVAYINKHDYFNSVSFTEAALHYYPGEDKYLNMTNRTLLKQFREIVKERPKGVHAKPIPNRFQNVH